MVNNNDLSLSNLKQERLDNLIALLFQDRNNINNHDVNLYIKHYGENHIKHFEKFVNKKFVKWTQFHSNIEKKSADTIRFLQKELKKTFDECEMDALEKVLSKEQETLRSNDKMFVMKKEWKKKDEELKKKGEEMKKKGEEMAKEIQEAGEKRDAAIVRTLEIILAIFFYIFIYFLLLLLNLC